MSNPSPIEAAKQVLQGFQDLIDLAGTLPLEEQIVMVRSLIQQRDALPEEHPTAYWLNVALDSEGIRDAVAAVQAEQRAQLEA